MANGYDECYDASWHLFPPDYVEEDYRILESIKMPRTSFHIHDILQLDSKPSQEETEVQVVPGATRPTNDVPSAYHSFSNTRRPCYSPRYTRTWTEAPYHPATWFTGMATGPTFTNHVYLSPWRKLMCCSSQTRRADDLGSFVPAENRRQTTSGKEEESADFEDEQQANEAQPHETEHKKRKKTSVVLRRRKRSSSRGVFDNRDTWARRKESIWPRSFDWRPRRWKFGSRITGTRQNEQPLKG